MSLRATPTSLPRPGSRAPRGSCARAPWRGGYTPTPSGLAPLLLFVVSFLMHWTFSAAQAADEAISHGRAPLSTMDYLWDAQIRFESFQNWQSEFLSTAALVVLTIFLRQRESPESKPVAAPHGQTGV